VAELLFTLVLASWVFTPRIERMDWRAIGLQSVGRAATGYEGA
jgi:hypothetical protein